MAKKKDGKVFAVTKCCLALWKAIRLFPVAQVIDKETKEENWYLSLYIGTDNIYIKDKEEFQDVNTMARVRYCPFCGKEVNLIKVKIEDLEGHNAVQIFDNSFKKEEKNE